MKIIYEKDIFRYIEHNLVDSFTGEASNHIESATVDLQALRYDTDFIAAKTWHPKCAQ